MTFHTRTDTDHLRAAGVDPDTTQSREQAVPCIICGAATWNVMAGCGRHYRPPRQVS